MKTFCKTWGALFPSCNLQVELNCSTGLFMACCGVSKCITSTDS